MEEIKSATAENAVERPKLTREEQEVIITMSAVDNLAEVYVADPVYMRRLDKLVEKDPNSYKVKSRNVYSATYTMPKKLLKFWVQREPRELTEEQRIAARERLKKYKKLSERSVESILSLRRCSKNKDKNIHHGLVMKLLY